jgi:anti-sigma regulatory factor (Ser/Thr protein kinase)
MTCPPRADARPAAGHPVTGPVTAHHAAHRASEPRFTPAPPPVPRDPAAPDHGWPDRWPLRSYLELAPLETAPRSARAHVGAVLWEWSLTAISDEAALVVSEMLTNAVLATRACQRLDPVRLWMLGSAGASVLFLVWDITAPAPVRRVTTPDAEHGRGLTIVDTLSTRWGYYHPAGYPGGKCVWSIMQPETR